MASILCLPRRKVEREIKKCIVLCAPCHRKLHRKEKGGELSIPKYKRELRKILRKEEPDMTEENVRATAQMVLDEMGYDQT